MDAGVGERVERAVNSDGMNFVLFGTIWGTKQTSQAALQHDRDFFFYNSNLYVFAPSNPGTYYGTVAAILLTNLPLISVNGKSWLTFQHLQLDWFDQYGVYVTGAADHLVFANMESDGMIPAGALPLGFYVNATLPGDVQFLNSEAHMNYDGFRFDGDADGREHREREGLLQPELRDQRYDGQARHLFVLALIWERDCGAGVDGCVSGGISGTGRGGQRAQHCGEYGADGEQLCAVSGADQLHAG